VTDRRLLHIGTFLGLSASAYALTLAAVSGLQARTDVAVMANREPTRQGIAQLAGENDALDAAIQRAGLGYEEAAGAYDSAGRGLAELETQLAAFASTIERVDGAARALPTRATLPKVARVVATARPRTVHATTGASGG
jgi:hypothetical protein